MDFNKAMGGVLVCLLGLLGVIHGQKGVAILPAEKNVIKFLNESYFVSCQSDQQMYWMDPKSGRVQSSGRSRVRTEQGIGLELYLNNITLEDAGTYACITKSGRAQFNLIVVRPIMFDARLAVQSAPEGRSFIMKCNAIGHSTNPQIFWKVDMKPAQGPNFQALQNGSLLIRNVTQQDARRNYICRAVDIQSPKPDTKQMEIQLKVKMRPRPRISERPDQWGVIRDWANLTCSVIAEPPATIYWYHKTTRLGNSDETLISKPHDNMSLLQVFLKNESKLGKYTCVAQNELGTYNRTLNLLKGKKPPKPFLKVEALGKDGVAIRVLNEHDPNRYHDPAAEDETVLGVDLDITGYVVQYKMLNKGDWLTPDVNRTTYGFILRGLVPNVTYIIRAASRNRAALGDYSQTLQITTPKDTEFNPPNSSTKHDSVLKLLICLTFSLLISL